MYSVLRSVMIVAGAEQRRHSRDIDEDHLWGRQQRQRNQTHS